MKKLLIALGLGALLIGTAGVAGNDKDPLKPIIIKPIIKPIKEKSNNAAVVINEEGIGYCSAYMDVGGDLGILFLIGTDVHVVMNKNMMKTVCKLDIPEWVPVGPESAIVIKDFECDLYPDGDGNDNVDGPWWCSIFPWASQCQDDRLILESTAEHFVWTPSNEATLQCTYKFEKPEKD